MIGSLDISRLAAGLAASGALPDASAQRLATHRTRRPQWFDRADPAPAPAFESSAAPARAAAASSSSSGASKHANASCRSARALARRVEFCCCGAVGAGGPVVFRADKKSGKPKGFGDLEEWPLLPPIEDRLGLSAAKFLSPILPGFDDEELETLPACKRCNGTGIVTCGVCKGVGDMRPFSRKPCLSCNGEKTTHCYECYGTGKYSVEKPSGVFTPMTDGEGLTDC
eukprot:tig00021438_g21450.t1